MTEQPSIDLANIRKGDTIRVEYKGYDTQVTITGIAFERDYRGNWTTESHMNLTNSMRTPAEQYFLVDRPKPALPSTEGSVIRVRRLKSDTAFLGEETINKLAIRDHDGDWAIQEKNGTEYYQPTDILEWNKVTIIDETD